eukprot:ctg_299.g166
MHDGLRAEVVGYGWWIQQQHCPARGRSADVADDGGVGSAATTAPKAATPAGVGASALASECTRCITVAATSGVLAERAEPPPRGAAVCGRAGASVGGGRRAADAVAPRAAVCWPL